MDSPRKTKLDITTVNLENKMSVTDKYLKLKREYEQLAKLTGNMCEHIEKGEAVSEEQLIALWAWWVVYKQRRD